MSRISTGKCLGKLIHRWHSLLSNLHMKFSILNQMVKLLPRPQSFAPTCITKVYAIVKGLSGRLRHTQTVQKLNILYNNLNLLLDHENELDIKQHKLLLKCYKVKRILRIPVIASSLWKCMRHTPGKIPGLIKTFYWFQQETSTENTCYIKSLICCFWLHVILLCWPRHFRCSCSLHEEEERSNLILSYVTEKERLTIIIVFSTKKI